MVVLGEIIKKKLKTTNHNRVAVYNKSAELGSF